MVRARMYSLRLLRVVAPALILSDLTALRVAETSAHSRYRLHLLRGEWHSLTWQSGCPTIGMLWW